MTAQEWTTTSGNFWDQTYSTSPNNFYIERNAPDFFPPEDDSTPRNEFVTYYTAINPNNKNEGIIGIQLNQADYDKLLPTTVLETPYELSFISVFDKASDESQNDGVTGNLIWSKAVETKMDNPDVEWPRVLRYLEDKRKMQTEAMTKCEDGDSACVPESIA